MLPSVPAHGARTLTVDVITGSMSRWIQPSPQALLLAAAAGVDPRTAERAIRDGVNVVRTYRLRDAIVLAAKDLKIDLPETKDDRG